MNIEINHYNYYLCHYSLRVKQITVNDSYRGSNPLNGYLNLYIIYEVIA